MQKLFLRITYVSDVFRNEFQKNDNRMKAIRLLSYALCVAVLAAFSLAGCEELDTYSINAPSDLQNRIDSIADAKASENTGDTTYIDIATAIVGLEDYSAAWWTYFSDYFKVPANKLLHIEFVNHNGGSENNWNNWNLAVTNEVADRDADGYAEYFVLRSDAFGWGGEGMTAEGYLFDIDMLSHNYPDSDGDGDIWNDFRATMNGARVTLEIDHSVTGNVYVTATAVGTNGTDLVMTYNQPVSAVEDIVAFLICDASWFEMETAYLVPSKMTVVDDFYPVSIVVEGTPAAVELGNDDFWGDGIATVTFADGSTQQVDTADLSFNVIPDMTTSGKKTVSVAYSKTKEGAYGPAVSTIYTLEVTNVVTSIEAGNINYYYYGADDIVFRPEGIVVKATYADGSTATLENSALEFDYPVTVSADAGSVNIDIAYVGASKTFTTTSTATLVQGVSQVGANDFSTAWWTAFSEDHTIAPGAGKTIKMYCYSNELNSWHSPCVVLRKTDNTEYAVVRMDNFGWGETGYATATPAFDWNWDIFQSSINGSYVELTVTNNGDNTADIRYDVTYATGEKHFQEYAGITVESSDLNCALVIEGAYVVIVE